MDVPPSLANYRRFRARTPKERDMVKHRLVQITELATSTVSILLLVEDEARDSDWIPHSRVIYRWFRATTSAERVKLKRRLSQTIDKATETVSAVALVDIQARARPARRRRLPRRRGRRTGKIA